LRFAVTVFPMTKTVSVAQLGHGAASRAIRDAQNEPVLVSKENRPAAWIVSADRLAHVARSRNSGEDIYDRALAVIAAELYRDTVLTLGQAAKLAGLALGDFIDLCSDLDVAILSGSSDELLADVEAIETAIAQDSVAK
jgi:predicted HTH domain antitoxin